MLNSDAKYRKTEKTVGGLELFWKLMPKFV